MPILHRSPTIHRITTVADMAWTLLRVGVLYIGPLGVGLAKVLAMTTTRHQMAGVLMILAAVFIGGVAIAVAAYLPSRPRHRRRSASVRTINRRAARILIPAALGLATLMGILALSACTPAATVTCPTVVHVLPSDPASPCRTGF